MLVLIAYQYQTQIAGWLF